MGFRLKEIQRGGPYASKPTWSTGAACGEPAKEPIGVGPASEHTIHVRQGGYRDAKAAVRIADADATVTVTMPAAKD